MKNVDHSIRVKFPKTSLYVDENKFDMNIKWPILSLTVLLSQQMWKSFHRLRCWILLLWIYLLIVLGSQSCFRQLLNCTLIISKFWFKNSGPIIHYLRWRRDRSSKSWGTIAGTARRRGGTGSKCRRSPSGRETCFTLKSCNFMKKVKDGK